MSRLSDVFRKLLCRSLRGRTGRRRVPTRLGCESLEGRIVPTPVITVEKITDAREGGADGVFRFTRTGDATDPLTIDLITTGTAAAGDDYAADYPIYYITFPSGESTVDAAIGAVAGDGYDPDETAIVTIQAAGTYVSTPSSYTVGAGSTATITIEDDAAGTFELDSNDGQVWYDIAPDQVDPDEATDTAPLSNFTIVFAGQTFTEANADFSEQEPTAEFEYGDLVNIKFTVEFASPVAGFEKLIVDGGQVTGIDANTHDPVTPVDLEDKSPATIVLDFSTMTLNPNSYCSVGAAYEGGGSSGPVSVDITAQTTAQSLRDALYDKLKEKKVAVEKDPDSNTRLIIQAPAGKQLRGVDMYVNVSPLPTGQPKVHQRIKGGASFDPEFTFRNE